MGEQRPTRIAVVAVVAAAVMLILSTFGIEDAIAEAANKKQKVEGLGSAIVECPGNVGRYKLDEVRARPEYHTQSCDYDHPKQSGWVNLDVDWYVDEPGERDECGSRQPVLTRMENFGGLAWTLQSPTKRVSGSVQINDQTKVSLADAESQLRKLIAAAEPLAHPCVATAPPAPSEGPSCPLLLPGDLVRTDWYRGEAPAVEALSDGRYLLRCTYVPAYSDEGGAMAVNLEWKGGDPGRMTLCDAEVRESYHETRYQLGYHPVSVKISNELVERWGGQALADALVTAASKLTQRCPDAPDGPAPYEEGAPGDPTTDATPTTTDIVLSGGPDDVPPVTGTTIELPEDDQHQLVVGGPDGEVIREEFFGDQATIGAYGPLVTDADGNWSVLVTVDVTTASGPAPLSSSEPSPVPTSALTPEPTTTATPVPGAASPDLIAVPATPPPSSDPASASPPVAPTEALGPTASPTPISPPELIGVPPGIAAIVAELPPAGAGAVRDVSDHVAVLGELLETEQSGEVTVPASDIGSLRELLPDLVQEVWLTDGSIVVSTTDPDIGSILVKPVIGDDGLISVKLSQYQIATFHPVVRALVAALNGYVAERGGRFTSVSVTPAGLTVTAER